jgi:hypothetical protein
MAVSLDGFVARRYGVIDWLSTRRSGCVDRIYRSKDMASSRKRW